MPTKKTTKSTASRSNKSSASTKKTGAALNAATKKNNTTTVTQKNNAGTACGPKCSPTAVFTTLLLIVNTILLIMVLANMPSKSVVVNALEEFEAVRVGGEENHEMMKEIYELDAYKQDQKFRIQQTLNALKNAPQPNTQGANVDTNALPVENQ